MFYIVFISHVLLCLLRACLFSNEMTASVCRFCRIQHCRYVHIAYIRSMRMRWYNANLTHSIFDYRSQSTVMNEEVEETQQKSQMCTLKLIGERFSVESDILASSHKVF